MARRNPLNERYQKNTAPAGKTRKSAASLKPTREAKSSSANSSAKKSQPTRSNVFHPPTPEYKKLRRVWWGLIGASIALSTGAWWMWKYIDDQRIGTGVLVAGYACIAVAIWIDWSKLRPLRQEWLKSNVKTQASASGDAAAKNKS